MYFEIYTSNNQWRWRLKSANNKILASGEAYHNKQDALDCINLIKSTTAATPVKEVAA